MAKNMHVTPRRRLLAILTGLRGMVAVASCLNSTVYTALHRSRSLRPPPIRRSCQCGPCLEDVGLRRYAANYIASKYVFNTLLGTPLRWLSKVVNSVDAN